MVVDKVERNITLRKENEAVYFPTLCLFFQLDLYKLKQLFLNHPFNYYYYHHHYYYYY